jgi:hypothetical protein
MTSNCERRKIGSKGRRRPGISVSDGTTRVTATVALPVAGLVAQPVAAARARRGRRKRRFISGEGNAEC